MALNLTKNIDAQTLGIHIFRVCLNQTAAFDSCFNGQLMA